MTEVRWKADDQVMRAVLDGEPTMNSIDPVVLDGLEAMMDAVEADPSLRAVVITGAGTKAFSVGMDLDFLERCFGDPDGVFVPFLERFHAVLRRLERLPVPVVAQVNGLARAGGFELILACDLVVAAEEARVGDIHLDFGVPPGAGSSQRAARKLGDQRAKALMLTPRWLQGPELVTWGLALATVPRDRLDEEVEQLLGGLRGRSRPVIALVKRLVGGATDVTLDEGLRLERALFERFIHEVPDAAEGFTAFREKRPATWGDADVQAFV
ncbi:enoyl-CoA hydratase-related protein [Nocardioides sp. TF02-7]|uniref:enoyl-CoA hydratase/isomerase family protein n=1 Tax=Nocardioides sp. TF02-7 TaxID=2917724 RepID=UPI001F057DD6|nr:enoyl-CoA hydratase-related protein [Nocardioides sp. TF02-7]UMG93702.1 enoyl-CoA hydratase-related protein [Nocardioides sp. TF02-7]